MKTFKIKEDKQFSNGGHYHATNVNGIELRAWAINDDWFSGVVQTKKGNCLFLMGCYRTLEQVVENANSFIKEKADYIKEALEAEKA